MCGRYSQTLDVSKLIERFKVKPPPFKLSPRYNIAPSQDAPVIVNLEEHSLKMFRWGLIPSWAKDPSIGQKMINARLETLQEKPSFKRLIRKKRCLVISDGFYEWKKESNGKTKTPMRVFLKSREPFAFAGLWDTWKNAEGIETHSFTIITTEAIASIKTIHERMPVILDPKIEESWLDPELEPSQVLASLTPFPTPEKMEFYPVSKLINSPKNDLPECIDQA
ncbi:MAG TPA: SOS response-associated peptidase [Nitrospiria bacterium]|jgi:putative SOS response-associated peptidase YedK